VRGLLDAVVTGDEADASKPAADVVEICWQRLGGGSAKMVGDTVYDVAAARPIGLPCIAVRTGGFCADELTAAGAVLVADDLTALIDEGWAAPTA